MARSQLKGYLKTVVRGGIKYIKDYVKNVINDIDIKSFKKYKYNFLFEFLGSFIFAFFISIYMLNSNHNQEYIIQHTKQINPYKYDDIFISVDELLNDNTNDIIYNEENEIGKYAYNNVLLEMGDTKNEDGLEKGNNEIEEDFSKGNTQEKEVNKYNLEKPIDLEKAGATTITKNKNNSNLNEKETKEIQEEKTVKMKKTGKNIYSMISKEDTEMNNAKAEHKFQEKGEAKGEAKGEEKGRERKREEVIKDVEHVIFKDDINKYSKIKIDDIDRVNLEDVDEYAILKNMKQKYNGNSIIYTIFGCLIYVFFVVLGAHINPAYTYALWILEPHTYGFFISSLYMFFQYMGGILASILCAHMYGSIFFYSLLPKKKIMKTFMCESVCTFIMTLLLISLHQYKKRYFKENKEEDFDYIYNHTQQIRNMVSSTNLYDDIYDYNNSNSKSNKIKGKKNIVFQIKNNYVKYILNHIFYITFIFFSLLFFVFVTNTTLNPMFSTSTLYTYLYFKIFRGSRSLNLYSIFISFLSFHRILQLIILYVQSLPFWIGPYVGSTAATYLISVLKNEDEEVVNVIDTNVYKYNRKREEMPLVSTNSFNDNAYLMEYNNNISQNVHTCATPAVF